MGRPKGSKNKKTLISDVVISAPTAVISSEIQTSANYNASIKVLGRNYTSTGDSLIGAISNLNPGGLVKATSIISISHNNVIQDKIFNRSIIARLFSPSPMIREIAIKVVAQRFSL